ncbi:MAG: ATPase, T2SS/T4P/T4SS family [Methylophilus sp.]|nr:ATPase, T2SS/T4P/T4SS family [Methylophilus sp.]
MRSPVINTTNNIVWPTPHYMNLVPAPDNDEKSALVENCIIYLLSNEKLYGELQEFSPENSAFTIKNLSNQRVQTYQFDTLKSLQLLKPMQIEHDKSFLEERAEVMFNPSEKQTYSVDLNNTELIKGYTHGYVSNKAGLFLYPQINAEKITRVFIPALAIKSFKIGMLLGEMLVEQNLASNEEITNALNVQNQLRTQKIGDVLSENKIVSSAQLAEAIAHQESQPILKLGEALKQLHLITEEQLVSALAQQKENRSVPLGQVLINMGVIDERTLHNAMAKKLGIPFVSLDKFNFDPNALRLVKAVFARKNSLIPLCIYKQSLVIAFQDPMNNKVIEELRFLTQMNILPAMASRDDITEAINNYYGVSDGVIYAENNESSDDKIEFEMPEHASDQLGINDLASKLVLEETPLETFKDESIAESDNTLVQLVNKMILDAHKDGVSDIHIETYPDKKNTHIRFRKDGGLKKYLELPSNFRNALISRIKIMSQLDISEKRKPQDGKIDFKQFGPAKIELRVATIPTANGLEDVVMRLLAASKPVPIDSLNLSPARLEALKQIVQRPYGLILVCGPTGSGKTTTLHSLLGYINTPERKIWTAEDPVEITQTGLRQVQVNAKTGWTFAAAMRSFLRADPDVIMVGEMRDYETTHTGIEASLTGHLVLSTLHTNSAPESITRMLDLGMDPFNFADALLAIMAQRLAKTLCANCKENYTPTDEEIRELATEFIVGTAWEPNDIIQQWKNQYTKNGEFQLCRAKGCKTCDNTGYKGRLGLYEMMLINPELKHLIQTKATVSQILSAALDAGMNTLKQDGIQKVLQGLTDITQVRAVAN